MTQGIRRLTALAGAAAAYVALCGTAAAGLPPLTHLAPGARANVHQRVPVQVVFVGLERGTGATGIDEGLLDGQLQSSRIVSRTTRLAEQRGVKNIDASTIGLTLDYDYRAVFADRAFEDAFFSHLDTIAQGPFRPSAYQRAYSDNPRAAEHITSSDLIDATEAERWLAANAGPMLGVDTTRPTVFLINWYGRPDFRFHTYAFLGLRPGAPFPLGFSYEGQMVAWGGTPADGAYGGLGREARVWFYDFSAGPDYRTSNWQLDRKNLDAGPVEDYRIPPIWEYGTAHWFRPFDSISDDIGGLLRFVAVDELFGAHPLYDPALSEPLLSNRVELDANVFAGNPGHDPFATLDLQQVSDALSRLDPTRSFPVDLQVRPLDGKVAKEFDCVQAYYAGDRRPCNGHANTVDAFGSRTDLDPFLDTHGNQFLDGTRYELPMAVFDVPSSRVVPGFPWSGRASGGRRPGTSGWVQALMYERRRAAAIYTDTGTVMHEAGHALGLSHTHDFYDPGIDEAFTASGDFWFAFAGEESYSGMSHLPNTDDFGQFERDDIARWNVAARIDNANRILADIAASPKSGRAAARIAAADVRAGDAKTALNGWNLLGASRAADEAYRLVLAAAADAGVKVEPYSGTADERGHAGTPPEALGPSEAAVPQPPGAEPGELLGRR
jgi:hypothetical protein